MGEREGVIKYRLDHRQGDLPEGIGLNELNAWRTILYRLNLIGRIPEKYQGLGFGNISRRLVPGSGQFIITATQTGDVACLTAQHYALIMDASPQNNSIQSLGPAAPSSEALTHACVYRQQASVQAVIHVHSRELWRNTLRLGLPHTNADIAYGTPEMAKAVEDLFLTGQLDSLQLFSMLGHEDGIVAFGATLADAANLLIAQLAKAIEVELDPTVL